MASVPKKDLANKLSSMYKVHDQNSIVLFGFKHDFGGGRSTGFGLIYDNLDKLKKFSPNYVLKKQGLPVKSKRAGRRAKKDAKNRAKKVRGKEKAKVKAAAAKDDTLANAEEEVGDGEGHQVAGRVATTGGEIKQNPPKLSQQRF